MAPAIVSAVGLALCDLFDSTKKPDRAERRKRVTDAFQQWRNEEVLRTALDLRRRDNWISAITAAVDLNLLTEDEAAPWLATQYNGYSDLEWRFETLRTGSMQEAFQVYAS